MGSVSRSNTPILCFFYVFVSPSDGLVVVGVHSAKFPNEKVSVFPALVNLDLFLRDL